jgi:hypothetical protein
MKRCRSGTTHLRAFEAEPGVPARDKDHCSGEVGDVGRRPRRCGDGEERHLEEGEVVAHVVVKARYREGKVSL